MAIEEENEKASSEQQAGDLQRSQSTTTGGAAADEDENENDNLPNLADEQEVAQLRREARIRHLNEVFGTTEFSDGVDVIRRNFERRGLAR